MDDVAQVEAVVDRFLAAFRSGPDAAARLDDLRATLMPGAVVVRAVGDEPTTYDVEGFIAPREALLTGGSLEDFREWSLGGETTVFGNAAQHACRYAKTWVQDGRTRTGSGWKSLQLVRTGGGWRISAVVWDDDR